MEAAIRATLKLRFAAELIHYEAVILLALVTFWIAARWEALKERYSSQNLGLAVALIVFGFAGFMSVACALDWGSEYYLLALTLGLGVGLALSDTALSICFFLALLFLRPWEIIVDNDYLALLPKLSMSVCIANAVLRWAKQKAFNFKWNRTATFLVAFAAWALLTTYKGGNTAEHQSVFFDNFFKCVFLFLLILNATSSKEEVNVILWTFVITMFGVGAVSIIRTNVLAAALEGIATQKVRLIGMGAFENSNDVAALMVMVLPFALIPIIRKGTTLLTRVFCIAMVGVVMECVRLSQSRGALMGAVAIVGIMILSTMKNRKHAIVLASLGVAGVVGMASVSGRSEVDLAESKEIRIIYIETGIMMGVKNPVFGVGFDGYADNFAMYQTGVVDGAEHRTAHNSWVLAFAETGLPGLLLFAAVYFTSLVGAFRFRQRRPEFFLAIAGYGIAMSFLSHTYFIYPYVLYALAGVAARLYLARELPQEKAIIAPAAPEPLPS